MEDSDTFAFFLHALKLKGEKGKKKIFWSSKLFFDRCPKFNYFKDLLDTQVNI